MTSLRLALQIIFIGCVALSFNQPGQAESDPRYSVMQFDGMTEFLRGSPFSLGSDSNLVLPSETVTTPVRLVVVADRLDKEVWLFARMSPWRLDLGVIDLEREFLWHQTDEGYTQFFEQKRTRSTRSMWATGFRSVFADAFAIPVDEEIARVVETISIACKDGLVNASAENIAKDDLLQRRIPSTDRKSLVVNHFQSGEITSAVRIEILDEGEKCYDLVSNVFVKEKPVEIRRGTLRLSQVHSLPSEIEKSFVHVDSESSPPVPPAPSKNRLGMAFFQNVALGVFWFTSIAFLLAVLCFQFLIGGKKNDVSS